MMTQTPSKPGKPEGTMTAGVRDRITRVAELLRERRGQRTRIPEIVERLSAEAWSSVTKTNVSQDIKRLRDEFGWQISGGHKGVTLIGPDPGPFTWPDEQDPFAALEDL